MKSVSSIPVSQTLTDPNSANEKPQRSKYSSWTLADATISSTDSVEYRHWSVDTTHDLVYMCDRQVNDDPTNIGVEINTIQPYRPGAGSACWISKDQGALWIRE